MTSNKECGSIFFRETTSKNSILPILKLVENIRTENGPRQKIIVSLGAYFNLPKENRKEVARIVRERLTGQNNLFDHAPHLVSYADKIIKKIQTEGKWNSSRKQVCDFNKEKDKETAEIFVNDVQHGYGRELGPVLIEHCFWEKLNFSIILRNCGFNESQIKTAEISVLNRLISQDSEHGIPSWIQTVAIDEILDLDTQQFGLNRFYRVSDYLLKHKNYIEGILYNKEKNLFNLKNCILKGFVQIIQKLNIVATKRKSG